MFSSRCATEEVPGIGSITALRCSSQAMESCATEAPWRFAILSSLPPWARELAGCDREPGDEGDVVAFAIFENIFMLPVTDVV